MVSRHHVTILLRSLTHFTRLSENALQTQRPVMQVFDRFIISNDCSYHVLSLNRVYWRSLFLPPTLFIHIFCAVTKITPTL